VSKRTRLVGFRPLRTWLVFAVAALLPAGAAASQAQARVVRGLRFEGSRAIDEVTLAAAIATTNSSAWATKWFLRWLGLGEKRYFDEVQFQTDVVRLVLLYRQSGYMNAVVDTVVDRRRNPEDVYVTFRIHEGEPVRVMRIDIQGAEGVLNAEALKRDLPLQVSDPFNRFLLLASADTVVARLKNLGYPYAEVLRNFDSDAGQLRAEVTLEALPGPRMRIGDVAIQGLEDIDTGAVRRMLSVATGNLYRQRDLFQSQRDLYGMDVFRSANVLLLDSLPPVRGQRADTTVRVLVRLVEGPRHRVRIGAGYGSLDCLRTQAAWSAHDFFGGARTLTVSGRLSKLGVGSPTDWGFERNVCPVLQDTLTSDTLNYSVGVTLEQPAFLSPRHRASVGLFAERRSEIQAYIRQAIGFNTGVTFNARRAMPVTASWGYSLGRTSALPAVYCSVFRVCDTLDQAFLSRERAFAAATVTGVRDRVNSPLDPTRGSVVTATVVYASRLVGSDSTYEFNRGELEVARYYPLGRYSVFAWRVRVGTILPQRITLSGQGARFVPPDQRFYGGGPNSVRGYGRNELGPRVYVTSDSLRFQVRPNGDTVYADLRTAPTGGNSAFVLNAELRLPSPVLRQRVRIGLFVDVGQVWDRENELLSFERIRITPGLGVRFATPLGPVRLDAAYNSYDREEGPLYFQNNTTNQLTIYRDAYRLRAPSRFRDRIVLQFAVGQVF
jgi:outer membrane protein insertion porin family